jgi:hypothetical protein
VSVILDVNLIIYPHVNLRCRNASHNRDDFLRPRMKSLCHAGHIQQIFSQYRRLAFSVDLCWKIETFAFCTKLPTFCKMFADNMSRHEWEKFFKIWPTCVTLWIRYNGKGTGVHSVLDREQSLGERRDRRQHIKKRNTPTFPLCQVGSAFA